MGDADRKQRRGSREGEGYISPWEWGIAALGLALVVGMLVFLGHEALAGDSSPPALDVKVESVSPSGDGYLVRFKASNKGGSTAAQVRVVGVLGPAGGAPLEASEVVLDYVPAASERGGGLFFSHDPKVYPLKLRAQGYQEP